MARTDGTWWQKFLVFDPSNSPAGGLTGVFRAFEWLLEPAIAAGVITVRLWGAYTDDVALGSAIEPDVATDITEALTGQLSIVATGAGDSLINVVDNAGLINAYNFFYAEFVLDTAGANVADFSLRAQKQWIL
jgi:hypothetical protein